MPDEIEFVSSLGLSVQTNDCHTVFSLPCPLYRESGCTTYADRPSTCRKYKCDLLRNYLVGTINLEQALPIILRVRELLDELIARFPSGYSFEQVRHELGEDWNAGQGLFASAEMQKTNAQLFLAVAKLARYSQKYFCKPMEKIN